MVTDEEQDLSLTSLTQAARVVLDTVKLLDRGERAEESDMTDEELEELLGERWSEEDS